MSLMAQARRKAGQRRSEPRPARRREANPAGRSGL